MFHVFVDFLNKCHIAQRKLWMHCTDYFILIMESDVMLMLFIILCVIVYSFVLTEAWITEWAWKHSHWFTIHRQFTWSLHWMFRCTLIRRLITGLNMNGCPLTGARWDASSSCCCPNGQPTVVFSSKFKRNLKWTMKYHCCKATNRQLLHQGFLCSLWDYKRVVLLRKAGVHKLVQ